MWLRKGPQTELAPPSSPADEASVYCIQFAQSQWAVYVEPSLSWASQKFWAGLSRNGWTVSQAHMWFQGEQWKDVVFGERTYNLHLTEPFWWEGNLRFQYLCEIIFLFTNPGTYLQEWYHKRPVLANCCQGRTVWNTNRYIHTPAKKSYWWASCFQTSYIRYKRDKFSTKYQNVYIPRSHASFRVV